MNYVYRFIFFAAMLLTVSCVRHDVRVTMEPVPRPAGLHFGEFFLETPVDNRIEPHVIGLIYDRSGKVNKKYYIADSQRLSLLLKTFAEQTINGVGFVLTDGPFGKPVMSVSINEFILTNAETVDNNNSFENAGLPVLNVDVLFTLTKGDKMVWQFHFIESRSISNLANNDSTEIEQIISTVLVRLFSDLSSKIRQRGFVDNIDKE